MMTNYNKFWGQVLTQLKWVVSNFKKIKSWYFNHLWVVTQVSIVLTIYLFYQPFDLFLFSSPVKKKLICQNY